MITITYEEATSIEQIEERMTDIVAIEEVDGGWIVFTDAKEWEIWQNQLWGGFNMKYAVTTYFYDNGFIEGNIYQVGDDAVNYSNSLSDCDIYIDICDTYEEAKSLYGEIKLA